MQINDTNPVTLQGILQDMYFNGKFSSATFYKADLMRMINKVYKQLQEDIRAVNEDFFLLSAVTTLDLTSVNNGRYTLPTDLEKIKGIWIAPNPANPSAPLDTEYMKCDIITQDQITNAAFEFQTPTAVIFGDYFILHPTFSDVTKYPVTNGVRMYYIPTQPDLVNDTDVPEIFPDYHDVITWGSLIETATRLSQPDILKIASNRFTIRRAEMKSDASQRVLDAMPTIIDGQDNRGGWEFPFGRQSMS